LSFDFSSYFKQYEALAASVQAVFNRVREAFPEAVTCRSECSDCCYALFDLSLIEAVYVNFHFNRTVSGEAREALLERANLSDRQVYRLKRKAHRAHAAGRPEQEILEAIAEHRVRCALLNPEGRCDLYPYRPITCIAYGIPTSIRGAGHTCGKSGFAEGTRYPTLNMDIIQGKLRALSIELARGIGTHRRTSECLVPVSMALLTDYDDIYFGIERGEDDKR
jgi:Fe-S-cluster containining protein